MNRDLPHNDNYQLLISRLDSFIRKYYKNKIVKGIILVVSILLLSYLVVSILEYFKHFNTTVRTALFYSYTFLNALVIGYYIIYPILQLFKIGNIISHRRAANIIGTHFATVKDKLLNTLQLNEMMNQSDYYETRQLIRASIDQKINELKHVTFTNAINIFENRKYLKFTIIPLIIIGSLLIITPKVFRESTTRLIRH